MIDEGHPDDLLTLKDAAATIDVGDSTFRRWRAENPGQLPVQKSGRFKVVRRSDLLAVAHMMNPAFGQRAVSERSESALRAPSEQPTSNERAMTEQSSLERSTSDDRAPNERSMSDERAVSERSEQSASAQATQLEEALARAATMEEENASLRERLLEVEKALLQAEAKLEATQEAQETYGRIFAGEIRQLTDQTAEQNQQTTALQIRASAEVHVARQEAGMLAEQLDDMRKGQELLAQAQKMTAEQYEARISDLRSGHVRELNAVREVAAAQVQVERAQRAALQEQLARTQGEVDRLVAQTTRQEAELAAYRAWAAKGSLGRMFGRPELSPAPEPPRALLAGKEDG